MDRAPGFLCAGRLRRRTRINRCVRWRALEARSRRRSWRGAMAEVAAQQLFKLGKFSHQLLIVADIHHA
jgi:hypothetical protein